MSEQVARNAPRVAIRNLCVLSYANGFTFWHYKAGDDDMRAVWTPGYFDDAKDLFADGDMIVVHAVDGDRIAVLYGARNNVVELRGLI